MTVDNLVRRLEPGVERLVHLEWAGTTTEEAVDPRNVESRTVEPKASD